MRYSLFGFHIVFHTHIRCSRCSMEGEQKINVQGILRVQSISMGHFCHGIRQQQKLHQFRFHWVKIIRFSGHYI